MSRSDKTRPYQVKEREIREADPYGWQRSVSWQYPQLIGCSHSCDMCSGWKSEDRQRVRREGRRAVRNWQQEY